MSSFTVFCSQRKEQYDRSDPGRYMVPTPLVGLTSWLQAILLVTCSGELTFSAPILAVVLTLAV